MLYSILSAAIVISHVSLAQPVVYHEPNINWQQALTCTSSSSGNSFDQSNWASQSLQHVVSVLIVGSIGRVQTKRCNYAVDALNKGKELSYQLDESGNFAGQAVPSEWYGDVHFIQNSCSAPVDDASHTIYHACGNSGGMHLGVGMNGCRFSLFHVNENIQVYFGYDTTGAICGGPSPIFPEPNVHWQEAMSCSSSSSSGNSFDTSNWGAQSLANVVSVLIVGSSGTVQTQRCNYAVKQLNKGFELSYQVSPQRPADLSKWYGDVHFIQNSCLAPIDPASHTIYHACGNSHGMHLGVGMNGCRFTLYQADEDISVYFAYDNSGATCPPTSDESVSVSSSSSSVPLVAMMLAVSVSLILALSYLWRRKSVSVSVKDEQYGAVSVV